jgi:predicted nucleic acid-binding protein
MTGASIARDDRVFVDTNVFLRYFTNDKPELASAAEVLFHKAAAGQIGLITNTMVLAEFVWVLESYYHLAPPEVQERAMAVALMQGLLLPEGDLVMEALSIYVDSNVDFVDAFNACWMKQRGVGHVLTLDTKHYSRLDGVEVQPF